MIASESLELIAYIIKRLSPKLYEYAVSSRTIDAIDNATFVRLDEVSQTKYRDIDPEDIGSIYEIGMCANERRNTGSHYTPRKLTEPVVRKTLAPILAQLGEHPNPSQILDLKVLDPACGSGAFLVEACRQLGAAVVRAWETHGGQPPIPADETPELYAMRLVAQRCLYGVDINPTAVNLCKLSLWLATLSKDQPFTFLDHAIRTGDALVGLSRQQIAGFTWDSGPLTLAFGQQDLDRQIAESVSERLAIINAPDTMTSAEKIRRLRLSDDRLDRIRQIGNLCLAAFFGASTNRAREQLRQHYLDAQLRVAEGDPTALRETHTARQTLRDGEYPVTPFHWEIEFPEVFAKGTRQGFDAVIGNPPYAGIGTVREASGKIYAEYLRESTPESGGKCDLIAYFFRRSFDLLRDDGCLGLVATNTIAQGDTRQTGLRWICTNGGTIYDSMKRYPWTTGAAVVVSTVCIMKGDGPSQRIINGRAVPMITAYLFHSGGHDKPPKLRSNHSRCFEGNKPHCMGFTFDDNPRGENANSMVEMYDVIIRDAANAKLVHPFIGGQELNNSPVATHDRYIIDMNDLEEPEAREWPDLYGIIERQVKPSRMGKADDIDAGKQIARQWWKHGHAAVELADARMVCRHSYAASMVTTHWGITLVADETVCSHKLCVYPSSNLAIFPILQSRCHEIWARFFSSTRGDGLNYTPTDCFETFPFPPAWEGNEALRAAGDAYYAFREGFMRDQWVGLTQTYNLFHHPEPALALDRLWAKRESLPDWRAAEGVEESMARHLRPSALEETRRWQCARDGVPYDWTTQELRSIEAAGSRTIYPTVSDAVYAIERLRELHATMDRAVADAYGWTDLDLQCVFTPEHSNTPEEVAFPTAAEALEWQATQDEPIKWRYRWGEALHDEVLMRLMRLNEERAREDAGNEHRNTQG